MSVRLAAIVLIVLGVVALVYPVITYTTRETVLDVGPLTVTTEEEKRIPLAPILGGTAVAIGVGLLFVKRRT
jgi:uncharacterized protein YjeT (DUF2065 family)